MVFEDKLYSLDDLMHELVTDILIEVVALPLHWVFDAVLYGEQTEEEEKVVV